APDKLGRAVQLMDIHAEKGMHCVDCHFERDAHGNGRIYGEYPDAVEIRCVDCHGSTKLRADLNATTRAARALRDLFTPFGKPRFEWADEDGSPCSEDDPKCTLLQRSMLYPDRKPDGSPCIDADKDCKRPWVVKQVLDSIDPKSPSYNQKAAF